jgi:hypothetical protein
MRGTARIEVKRSWSTPRIQAHRGSLARSVLRTGARVSAASPLIPWPTASRAVDAVRGGQCHALAVTIDEVERAHLGAHGHGAAVDDELHELVPGRGGRAELDDLAQRRQLLVIGGGADDRARRVGVRGPRRGHRSLVSVVVRR